MFLSILMCFVMKLKVEIDLVIYLAWYEGELHICTLQYEYCYESCDSQAENPLYSDMTPKHDATNDLSQIINDHQTTYVDSQHQDNKQTPIFMFPCPVMPQYVYLGRLPLPKSPFMNFTTVTITSPLTPINLSNRPLFGIQGGILTL